MSHDFNTRIVESCKGENQRTFKRQRTILYQGEAPKSVYVIKKGVVRAYNIAENGEERTVDLLSEGDILPVSWLFGSTSATMYYYDAFSDVVVYVVPRERFMSLMEDRSLSKDLLASSARRYTAATMHVNTLLQTHAQNKIAQGLQYLALSHGVKLPNGMYKVTIRLTQQDLANLVGVTRETAAVELNRLRDKKIISYKSFTYTINYNALVRANGGDEFDNVSL